MPTRWTLRPVEDEALVARIARDLNHLPVALARTLVLRGVTSFEAARAFFRDGLEAAHDPFLLRDMDRAADRLAEAIVRGERVAVYGDYDVDGTTATAIMVRFLRAQGLDPAYFVPNRFVHGYGLSRAGLDTVAATGASLVVALDCGVTAVEEAAYARRLGLDLIVADHHEPGPVLPEALAVLDPKRPDCPYPFDGLSGCGVGFKLIQAVLERLGRPPEEAHPYLDLLAVSIAADIVPVLGENRLLMRAGLERLAHAPRPGLRALAQVAGRDLAALDSNGIVFGLGPRINAAGRVGSADAAVRLFLTDDEAEAFRLASELNELNRRRQELDRQTLTEAHAQAEALCDAFPYALVLHGTRWHMGVVGIVAARLAERFYRPTVLLTGAGGVLKGSARSVPGVSIFRALTACRAHVLEFGGHDAAAGVSLAHDRVDAFREALNEAVAAQVYPEQLVPELALDAELPLADLDARFWRVLAQIGPHGPDNPRPLFLGRGLTLDAEPRAVGREGRHLKLRVRQGDRAFPVIGFGLGDRLPEVLAAARAGRPLELAFCVEEHRWNGHTELQLQAKDVRAGQTA